MVQKIRLSVVEPMARITLFRKYRGKGAACMASAKLPHWNSFGSQENDETSPGDLREVRNIQTNGRTMNTPPRVSTMYSSTRPTVSRGRGCRFSRRSARRRTRSDGGAGRAAPAVVTISAIGIAPLRQPAQHDEDCDQHRQHDRFGGGVAQPQPLERVGVDVVGQHGGRGARTTLG